MIWFLCLLCVVQSSIKTRTYQFSRVLTCGIQTSTTCIHWIENTVLNAQYTDNSNCFPEDTYVLTDKGPKKMSKLRIGDSIWGYDKDSRANRYSTLIGWLHRDEWAESICHKITTKEQRQFVSSIFHNVAKSSSSGEIQYAFAAEVSPGSQLISPHNERMIVESVESTDWKRGLYSPFTELGNYYVFASNIDPNQQFIHNGQGSMMLAHVLSQFRHPQQVLPHLRSGFGWLYKLGLARQPQTSQAFKHPLSWLFSHIYSSSWHEQPTTIRYFLTKMERDQNGYQVVTSGTYSSSASASRKQLVRISEIVILNGIQLQMALL